MTHSTVLTYSSISQSVLVEVDDDKYFLLEPVSKNDTYFLMLDLLEEEYFRPDQLTTPDTTKRHLQLKLAKLEHEVFSVVLMDSQHRVIHYEELFRGTIDAASVYPREVVKHCLQHNAAAVIFSHSHPSGIPGPSQADITITKRLKEDLQLSDVRVLDHIVIGGANSVSMVERDLI